MKRNLNWLDRVMLVVTFAEAGCPELAGDYATVGKAAGKSRNCHGADGCATSRGVGAVHHAANR